MEHCGVTKHEAYMMIYGLACAAAEEEIAYESGLIYSLDTRDEFLKLGKKLQNWLEEAKHNGNS